ncbi:MAG: histidine--tRNA ligase [Bacilli bacterium]|nr:histidine--tRNA ligase [Bacilli bacterium]
MIQKLKGTYDVYGDLAKKHDYVKKLFQAVCESYNYSYIETPLIERSELFHRGVGETTDIVTKETYDFLDRGNRENTIRPEGTAGIARAIIEDKLYNTLPLKLWYIGSMFRYERPQKGRYRELRQMGVEFYGSNDPISDAEVISLGINFLKELGLKDVKVKINSIGGTETRIKYKDALIKHFKSDIDNFCDDCKERLTKNPLRILDCKIDSDKELIKNAPSILDYLNDDEVKHFEKVKEYLDTLEIEYEVDDSLVRGLDYYTNTVFEYVTKSNEFGSIGGGGRYNNLLKSLDGPDVPAVGFAFGLDRIVSELENSEIKLNLNDELDCYILTITEKENDYALELAQKLRMCGFKIDLDLSGKNMKNKFKEADRYKAKQIIIIGEDEVINDEVTIRDNITKEETKVTIDNIIDYFDVNL